MARNIRESTKKRTAASVKAARDVGYAPKPRKRKQHYTRSNGLVGWKTSTSSDDITVTNATASPLLRLPAEIRSMIFEYVCTASGGVDTISIAYEELDAGDDYLLTCTGLQNLAVTLPLTCRQIYAETATLMYSQNCFEVNITWGMMSWLRTCIVAQ
ncbi:hypothetical protein ACEQ8H_008428, partial [Pleosporales sp. CAS-2024a]